MCMLNRSVLTPELSMASADHAARVKHARLRERHQGSRVLTSLVRLLCAGAIDGDVCGCCWLEGELRVRPRDDRGLGAYESRTGRDTRVGHARPHGGRGFRHHLTSFACMCAGAINSIKKLQ